MAGRAAVLFILLYLGYAAATLLPTELESRELALTDVPPCGIKCLLLKIPSSGCSLDDRECTCGNQKLAGELAGCMLANCTMADTLGTARYQAKYCTLSNESKRTEMFLVTGIVYALALMLVALRVAGKVIAKRSSLDDWMVATALLLGGIPLGCVLAMTKLGFGEHLWNLEDGRLLLILRYFLIASATYVIVLGLIKVSLILFYLEIFKTTRFRTAAYGILIYICVNNMVIFMLTIFSCTPVQSFWNRDVKGKCLDVQALAYANSASAIIQDLILLILPLVFIRNLQMRKYKKMAVGFMLSVGVFGCIATIIRLHALLQFKISIDPTWDYVPATIWTILELAAGFTCVSLPSIRLLAVRLIPSRVKDLFSRITHPSRSRSTPPSDPNSNSRPRQWKKPNSWLAVSNEANDSGYGSLPEESFLSRVWSRHSSVPSTHRHVRQGSRKLESALSNYSESGVAVTRPPYREKRHERNDRITRGFEHIEMLQPPKKAQAKRPSLLSNISRDSQLTALPPINNIGCLPEGSFSDLNIGRTRDGRDRNKNITEIP